MVQWHPFSPIFFGGCPPKNGKDPKKGSLFLWRKGTRLRHGEHWEHAAPGLPHLQLRLQRPLHHRAVLALSGGWAVLLDPADTWS